MGTTFYHSYPYPESSDTPDGAAQIRALAEAIDSDMWTIQVNAGYVQVTASTAGQADFTFGSAYGGTPVVMVAGENSLYNLAVTAVDTTGFTVAARHVNATSATTQVWFTWLAVGKPPSS